MQKYCPNCGEMYPADARECPACHVPLEHVRPDEDPDPRAKLVAVLETTETGVLPLARMALEQDGIEYVVKNRGFVDQIMGRRSSMTVGETDTPLLVLVRTEDEARARAVLSDLAAAPAGVPAPASAAPRAPAPPDPTPAAPSTGGISITDADSGASLGTLTRAQFDSLAAHLELESSEDDDYYIDEATVAMLEEQGADPAAVALLRRALGGRSDVTIRWR